MKGILKESRQLVRQIDSWYGTQIASRDTVRKLSLDRQSRQMAKKTARCWAVIDTGMGKSLGALFSDRRLSHLLCPAQRFFKCT